MEDALNCYNTRARTTFKFLFVVGFLMILLTGLYSQGRGIKFLRNYSDDEYDHLPQNFGMVQGKNGLLYFANIAGVLEYDGVSWRLHYLGPILMKSLAIDESGTIFVGGGNNDIWRLSPNAAGQLNFVSLLDQIPKENKKFGSVRTTHALKGKVYFVAKNHLFIWNHKKMVTLKSIGDFKGSFIYNEEVIVQDSEKGMLRIVGNRLIPLPGGKQFGSSRIRIFTPFSGRGDNEIILTGSREMKLLLYDGQRTILFKTDLDAKFEDLKLHHGIRLSSGEFALGTRIGLFILDSKGRLIQKFDRSTGLQNENVYYVFQDNYGNIWLCLDQGITKIQYNSPLTQFNVRTNLPGLVLSTIRHRGKLYAGTSDGLFQKGEGSTFIHIPGISGKCNSLLSTGDHLLAATEDGVFQVEENSLSRIAADVSLTLLASKYYDGVIWCGTDNNTLLALENPDGQWRETYRLEQLEGSIHCIVETAPGELWLGTAGENVIKLVFKDKFAPPAVHTFGKNENLIGRETYVAQITGNMTTATSNGLFKFNKETGTFIPDSLLGEAYKGGESAKPVFRIIEDSKRHIWFTSESRNYQVIPSKDGGFDIDAKPFRPMPLKQINVIYPDADEKVVWFGGTDGLFRFNTSMEKNYSLPFKALVRKVVLNQRSEHPTDLFFGHIDKESPLPEIDFRDRNIYFEYAAPFYENESDTVYQCRLVGYDDQWTAWSEDSNISYTNLDPGDYTFQVKAKNVYETESEVGVYSFRVLIPWYMSWWMISIYILLLVFSFYMAVRWRSQRLFREKMRLEKIVKERTSEIQEQKNQLEHQTIQLRNQSEKLKEMDHVKARFFANISHEFRTPLTLIMGPLEQMLAQTPDENLKKKYFSMLHHSQQLLNLINQLLDLSRLDSGKEKLRAARRNIVPFIKGIAANFEAAAQKKGLDLQIHAQSDEILFYFDDQKMEKVMNNLLMNAVKYTPLNGQIRVSTSQEDQFVKISVKDSGRGISPDQINFIFDRFFQADGAKRGGEEGTGIGLALVKEYVDLHHGKIDVHSREDKGAEFVLRFPRGKAHLEPGQLVNEEEIHIPAVQPRKAPDFETEMDIPEPSELVAEEEDNGKPTILVVEDNKEMRRYISESLQAEYQVLESENGEEGVETARKVIPDIIVSDIMMPGIDGYELCRTLKKDMKTSHIPIVLLTAKASEDSMVAGLDTGADDYITKPFNTRILRTRIKNLVELREQLQTKIRNQILLEPEKIDVSSMDRKFIKELKEAINNNISDSNFGVKALSKLIIMDRTTIYRKIKALTGETPQIFIRSYRLLRGAELLRKGFGTVSQVAVEVGFSNIAYFTTCFKEKFDILPSVYMETESGKEDLKNI